MTTRVFWGGLIEKWVGRHFTICKTQSKALLLPSQTKSPGVIFSEPMTLQEPLGPPITHQVDRQRVGG